MEKRKRKIETYCWVKKRERDESSKGLALRDDYNKYCVARFSRRRFGLSFLFPTIGPLFLSLWSIRIHVITPAGLLTSV